jgi:hypothetical protein
MVDHLPTVSWSFRIIIESVSKYYNYKKISFLVSVTNIINSKHEVRRVRITFCTKYPVNSNGKTTENPFMHDG